MRSDREAVPERESDEQDRQQLRERNKPGIRHGLLSLHRRCIRRLFGGIPVQTRLRAVLSGQAASEL